MIRNLAITHNLELLRDLPIEKLSDPEIAWYWVDFNEPSEEESMLLSNHFHFHHLAVEDCFNFLQRPKLDYYEGYDFFVLHALNYKTLEPIEVDMFIGEKYIITFHFSPLREVDTVWHRVESNAEYWGKGSAYISYMIIDKLVDDYFPTVYQIEDQLSEIENKEKKQSIRILMDEVFDIRSDLLHLRRTIVPMRDLLYRILNSDRIKEIQEHKPYFADIYDHLLKLTEMIDSNRDLTSDMRDSYISITSNRMNTIMMTLTIISSIFIPLTFIAGVYGMNFQYMPELAWRYGYFIVLGVMATVGIGMFLWFKRKGWLDYYK